MLASSRSFAARAKLSSTELSTIHARGGSATPRATGSRRKSTRIDYQFKQMPLLLQSERSAALARYLLSCALARALPFRKTLYTDSVKKKAHHGPVAQHEDASHPYSSTRRDNLSGSAILGGEVVLFIGWDCHRSFAVATINRKLTDRSSILSWAGAASASEIAIPISRRALVM